MSRLRSVRRVIAESQLLGILTVVVFLTAVGCVLAPADNQAFVKHTNHWVVPPATPQPASVRTALDPQLARVSFQLQSPAVRSGFQEPARQRVEAEFNRDEEKRVAVRDFGPIYRRPPPSFA
jgi:hypothetical protein